MTELEERIRRSIQSVDDGDWADVVRRARPPRRRRRAGLVLAFAALLAVVAAAVAAGERWSAQLRAGRAYVDVTAPSRELLLETVRALRAIGGRR